jgi:hypothetical protein
VRQPEGQPKVSVMGQTTPTVRPRTC